MKHYYILSLLLGCFLSMFGGNPVIEDLEIGLFDSSHSMLLGDKSAGTTLIETESINLSLAYAEYLNKQSPLVSSQYSYAVVNAKSYPLTFGLTGTTNPNDLSLRISPQKGTVYNVSVKNDGYIIIFSKFNLRKSYYVFENDNPIAYTLGFITTDGVSSVFSLPENEKGIVDLQSSKIEDYVDSELRLKPLSEINTSSPEEGSGSGFIMFRVEQGKKYMVCANGSKMNCGGYIFSRSKPKNVGFYSESGTFYDLIGDHTDRFDIGSGGVMSMVVNGLNGTKSIHQLTDSTVVSFDNGEIGIGSEDEKEYTYSIADLKNIIYSNESNSSSSELAMENNPIKNIPFYIYRNDGVINTFFSDEVKKFTYSRLDEDSICHEGVMTQNVHTQDTIYSINIELIDSIGFTSPQTIFNKDVVFLDKGIKEYILEAADNNITFRKDIPSNILPHIGALLVQMDPDEIFEQPFFGRVIEERQTDKGICLVCKDAELTEVFDSYCSTFMSTGVEEVTRSGMDSTNRCGTLKGGLELNFDLSQLPGVSITPDLDIAESIGVTDQAVFTPRIDYSINYRGTLIIDKNHGVNLRVNIDSDYDMSTLIEIVRELNLSKKWPFFKLNLPIPTPLLSVVIEMGAFLDANASVILHNTTTDRYKLLLNWEWSDRKDMSLNNSADIRKVYHERKLAGMLNGDCSIGIYAAVNIHPFRLDVLNVSPEFKAGIKLASSLGSFNWNTNANEPDEQLYGIMQKNPIGVYWTRSFNLNFEVGHVGTSIPFFPNVSQLNGDSPIVSLYHVPSFNNFTAKYKNGELTVNTDIKNNVLAPVNLGFALVNNKTKEIEETLYKVNSYTKYPSSMQHIFKVDLSEASYTVYPLVKWYGIEMLGAPSVNYFGICPDENHPHMIDLGLPSRKMWSCCNHGASSPDKTGLYLAWGESSEKSYYKYRTYKFWNDRNDNDRWDEGEFDDIGSNIQNTEYDPVSAINSGLAMPTKEEYHELIANCTWESFTLNDESGCLLTGPNGNHIFLPAAGLMVDYDLIQKGNGRYWTSNVDPADHCDAILLSFNGSSPSFTTGDRHNGRTIRPIEFRQTSVGELNIDNSDNLIIDVKNRIVRIIAPEECSITVNTIDGLHSILNLTEGLNEIPFSSGFYIINGHKVIVK